MTGQVEDLRGHPSFMESLVSTHGMHLRTLKDQPGRDDHGTCPHARIERLFRLGISWSRIKFERQACPQVQFEEPILSAGEPADTPVFVKRSKIISLTTRLLAGQDERHSFEFWIS